LPGGGDAFRPAVAENQPVTNNKNRMIQQPELSAFAARLRDFIAQSASPEADGAGEGADSDFNGLALSLFALQFTHNAAYRQFCESRKKTPITVKVWRDIPALPAAGFKEFELTSLPVTERAHVFHSSGTTGQKPGRHFHSAESLALYEDSLLPWFQRHLLPDLASSGVAGEKLRFIALTPPPAEAPHSSLVHMFGTVQREFSLADSVFLGRMEGDGVWSLDVAKTLAVLRESIAANIPVALLGTAFNYVHLLDHLEPADICLQLPAGSRALETGGYKGRSRVLPKAELHALMTRHLGLPPSEIVCEYGMSELSSQAYDGVAGISADLSGTFHFPPWARVQIVSPETGREVAVGETGLIRIFDLANVWSVMAVQTEDLGVRRVDGFELLGRAAAAEPRGCSLMSLSNA
jgi:hypothetical protein